MANYFDAIERHLAHAESTYEDDETYIHLLDSVIREANSRRMRASHRMFGAQFTPAAEVVETGDEATRQFQRGEKVRTKEGYIGHVAGYDKRGKVVVNVVWQACEYAEGDLRPCDLAG